MLDINTGPPIVQACVTRYVADLRRSLYFYAELLGLEIVFRFQSTDMVRGAILRLVDAATFLELIETAPVAPPHSANANHHLVLHFASEEAARLIARRLIAAGIDPVAGRNPFWHDRAVVFNDFDHVQLVLGFGSNLSS